MELTTYLLLMVASVLISASMVKKPETPAPATFDDFDFPQIEEGTPQCIVFGDCWTGDWQVIGTYELRTEPVKASASAK